MALPPGTVNEIRQHLESGFTDADAVKSLNNGGFVTPSGKPWTKSAFAYHRQKMGVKKYGGSYPKRKSRKKSFPANKGTAVNTAVKVSGALKDACSALLDCTPAQRPERISLVFQLLGVK